jgi:hypothetical protein
MEVKAEALTGQYAESVHILLPDDPLNELARRHFNFSTPETGTLMSLQIQYAVQ